MLDRIKVIQALNLLHHKLFITLEPELQETKRLIALLVQNPELAQSICQNPQLSHWQSSFDTAHPLVPTVESYRITAIDGSQIYPDRHQGTTCALINIGLIDITYQQPTAQVTLKTDPYVLAPDGTAHDVETINSIRHAYELQHAASCAQAQKKQHPHLILLDGSLIFWHLEGKDEAAKQKLLALYTESLAQLYAQQALVAWYISKPHTKELVQILRCVQSTFPSELSVGLDRIIDSHIAHQILDPLQRTTLFEHISVRTAYYPDYARPYFWYQHVGQEIARIEVPAWIAQDSTAVAHISAIIHDQTDKGQGYPLCLAEAHEQAVIKQPDREFFYYFLQKLSVNTTHKMHVSPKSMKKRRMGI